MCMPPLSPTPFLWRLNEMGTVCKQYSNCRSITGLVSSTKWYTHTHNHTLSLTHTYTHTHTHTQFVLLPPWSSVLLENLTGFQLVKKFPASYGTRMFIAAITRSRRLSLSWASSIQYIHVPPHPNSWRSILILSSSTPGSSKWSLSLRFPYQTLYTPLLFPMHTTWTAHLILLNFITRKTWDEDYRSLSSSLCSFLHSPVTSSILVPNTLINALFSNTYSLRSPLNVSNQVSHPQKTTGKIIVLYMVTFTFLDSKLEDKRFCTEWWQALPDFSLLLIYSWTDFSFVKVVPKCWNSFTLSKDLLSLFILWVRPAFWSRDMTTYLVLSAFTSSPVSLISRKLKNLIPECSVKTATP